MELEQNAPSSIWRKSRMLRCELISSFWFKLSFYDTCVAYKRGYGKFSVHKPKSLMYCSVFYFINTVGSRTKREGANYVRSYIFESCSLTCCTRSHIRMVPWSFNAHYCGLLGRRGVGARFKCCVKNMLPKWLGRWFQAHIKEKCVKLIWVYCPHYPISHENSVFHAWILAPHVWSLVACYNLQ